MSIVYLPRYLVVASINTVLSAFQTGLSKSMFFAISASNGPQHSIRNITVGLILNLSFSFQCSSVQGNLQSHAGITPPSLNRQDDVSQPHLPTPNMHQLSKLVFQLNQPHHPLCLRYSAWEALSLASMEILRWICLSRRGL
jgi:hypothetical protein